MEGNGSLERFESENQLWLQFRSVIEQVIFYWTQVSQVSDLWVPMSVTELPCWNLTDVIPADQATNSIPTDNANMAIQGNVAMQVRW